MIEAMAKLPQPFREGMLICAWDDPDDPADFFVFEVLAAGAEGLFGRGEDGCDVAFRADELDRHRLFQVGHVERGWFGRKRWVYGVEHPPPHWPRQSFSATVENLLKLKTELQILNSTPTDLR